MVKQIRYMLRVTRGGSEEAVKDLSVEVSDQFCIAKASSRELLIMLKNLLAEHLQPLEAERGLFTCAGCGTPATVFSDLAMRHHIGGREGILHCVYAICCHGKCEQSAEAALKAVNSIAVRGLRFEADTGMKMIKRGCSVCCDTDHLQQCGRCKMTRYCSAECQKSDWPKHKKVCAARVQATLHPPTSCRTIAARKV